MPILRPFRALRFDTSAVDLSAVLAPPYDIISPSERQRLLARDPHNAVRIELPVDLGEGDADAYRGAARAIAEWRSERILVKDRRPTVTVHEMAWMDDEGRQQSCTGLLARLRLEELGPGGGVRAHERTMSGPKEDRYQLLKATGLNTSPIVCLAGSDAAATSAALLALTDRTPDAESTTADGVRHRLWVRPTHDPGLPGDVDRPSLAGMHADQPSGAADLDKSSGAADLDQPSGADVLTGDAARVLGLLASAPVTIADGHHRYETALRYRAERGANRACESDPAWDYVLALIYPLDQAPPALPTHRVIRGKPCGEDLLERLRAYATLEPLAGVDALLARMAEAPSTPTGATGSGRIGLLTRDKPLLLNVDRAAIDALLPSGFSDASRGLDVNALSAIIGRAYGDDAGAMADDGRLWYMKDARAAIRQVMEEEASACYLLDAMPVAAISRVADAGEVMPHKSTYFHPKAPTGLLFSPMEW